MLTPEQQSYIVLKFVQAATPHYDAGDKNEVASYFLSASTIFEEESVPADDFLNAIKENEVANKLFLWLQS